MGVGEDNITKVHKRLKNASEYVWSRWSIEYITSLMEVHRLHRKSLSLPEAGEVVLTVGDERNKGEWKKARVEELVKGRDGVVRRATLRYKGHLRTTNSSSLPIGDTLSSREVIDSGHDDFKKVLIASIKS